MKLLLFSLILQFMPFTVVAKSGECFWPNGKKAPDSYVKCPGQNNCCLFGEACLSNNLCYGAKINAAYRGACVLQDWPQHSCTNVCTKEVSDTWANIYPCANDTNNRFTCGRPVGWVSEVCNDNMGKYYWDSEQDYNVTIAALPDPNAKTTTASSSATPTSSSSGSVSSQSGGTCTPAADDSDKKTALAAGLGAGLGVPLFLVSAGFLLVWLHMRKQLQEARAKSHESQEYVNALLSAQHGMVGVPHAGSPYGPAAELPNKSAFAGELDGSEMRAREMEG